MREVGVGDLIRAWHKLGVRDEATRRAIAALLLPNMTWTPLEETAEQTANTAKEPVADDSKGHKALVEPIRKEDDRTAPPKPDEPSSDFTYSATPEPHQGQPFRLPASGRMLAPDSNLAMAPEPLLDAAWSRRVLGGLITTEVPVGGADVGRLVRSLAEMREMHKLPRILRSTLRRGAQVLLDRHPSMLVFYSDQSMLRGPLQGFGGRERTVILRSDGFPPEQVSELGSPYWRDYELPAPGTPVLVVSDLGMARGAFPLSPRDEAEWDAFLDPLLSAGSTVCALVPCPPDRYPAFVRRRIHLLLWDLPTRPSDARRARRSRR